MPEQHGKTEEKSRLPTDVHSVTTKLNFIPHIDEKPWILVNDPQPGQKGNNFGDEWKEVKIHDLRGHENEPQIDVNGFQILSNVPSSEKEFVNEEAIKTKYYAEIEELLKKVTGGNRVFVFDHTIRRRTANSLDARGTESTRQPVHRVHVDQTFWAGEERVRLHMGEEAEELLKKRVEIINVWRPITGPVYDTPLTFCDYQSVDWKDLKETDLIYPNRKGETFSVEYNENQKWYYLSKMNTDEVVLLKCFDNLLDGRSRVTPHTAFRDPETPSDAPARQSIEVRALVFHSQ
eukprot:TRINITY_DN10251_c0_g1_i1.p1 TRINITY_DN10251_c0_g1~~TRINITY_DN10251_c0_g1_i1.p1  ORF type:complete len:291 (-),score=72.42 TRINITY_DN10251_c0_g1_i1:18-890(-)